MKSAEDKAEPTDDLQRRTIEDFGVQWNEFKDLDSGYYGERELFDDIVSPFLSRSDVEGKYVCEIGSGTGRISLMLLDADAAHVLTVEPSAAFDVLVSNTRKHADRMTYLNKTGSEIPAGENLDYVFSIGVIHHIPDPSPTVQAAWSALKPGGRMLIWLYGHEGNELYLAVVRPLRLVTRRLPAPILHGLTWLLLPLLWSYIQCCKVARLPMRDYMTKILSELDQRQLRANIYDQLNPAYAKYYREHEARALMESNGFTDVQLEHRHGYSWTVIGTRPVSSAS
jgi:SAM-dependent methyltransferase